MRRLLGALLIFIGCSQAAPESPVPWAHGWKTKRVVATRYHNPMMGYNVGFKFPLDPNDCDRGEINDFIEANKGHIYEGGGFPGAEAFVIFRDVKDKESADKKLQKILPDLDRLMASLQ